MTIELKSVKKEKCTLNDLEYVDKTENHEKLEIHTSRRERWGGKLKNKENSISSTEEHVTELENGNYCKNKNNMYMTGKKRNGHKQNNKYKWTS